MVYDDLPIKHGGSFHGKLLVITRWYNKNKWPIYRWFMRIYLLNMVIFHGYVSHKQMVQQK